MATAQKTKTKTRVKKTRTPVPQSRLEAANYIGRVGASQRRLDEIETRILARIARARDEYKDEIESIRKERTTLMNGLFAFCEARRAELTSGGKTKTAEFPTGTVAWRLTPPKVEVDDDLEMIEFLKSEGFGEYVRVREELNREALLEDRERLEVDGLSFSQREEFVVIPASHQREVKKTRTISLD